MNATDKQVNFILKLSAERGIDAKRELVEKLDKATASAHISTLLEMPRIPSQPTREAASLEPGMYRTPNGDMFRVYKARSGSHLLAKMLIRWEDGFDFEYAGSAGRFVKAEDRMTLEEAKAFGAEFGTCCVCAKLLTDPESVAKGIGPVCEGRV